MLSLLANKLEKLYHWLGQLIERYPKCPSICLLALGGAVYLNALSNQLFWDDLDSIVNNVYIKDWHYWGRYFTENLIAGAGLLSNYWRPVLLLLYSIEWHIWGDWAAGFHLISILIHLLSGVTLYWLLKDITKRRLLSWLTALVFLIHPLQTEAVTYVAGLADPLSAWLMLLSLLWYWRHFMVDKLSVGQGKGYWLSLAFFILAVMTKDKAIVLPALLVVVELYNWQKFKQLRFWAWCRQIIVRVWPWFGLVGGYLWLRATVLNFQDTFNIYGYDNYYTQHLSARLWTFLSIVLEYFKLFFRPHDLHMERLVQVVASPWSAAVGAGALWLLLLIGLLIVSWHYNLDGWLGLLWLGGNLTPASGVLTPVSGLMYEHYMYLPVVGWALFIFSWLLIGFSKFKKRYLIFIGALVGLVWLVFLSVVTWQRNAIWRDPITFYRNILQYNQQSLRVWNNYGMALSDAGQYQDAVQAYRRAINLSKDNSAAPPYHNLANALVKLGETQAAIDNYRQAISLDKHFYYSYNSLAALYISQKNYVAARDILKEGLQVMPDNNLFVYNLQVVDRLISQTSQP